MHLIRSIAVIVSILSCPAFIGGCQCGGSSGEDDDESVDDDASADDDDDMDDDDDIDDDDDVDDDDDDIEPVEGELIWSWNTPYGPRKVETLGWISDVDGDSVDDVLAVSYTSTISESTDHSVFCLSGAPDDGVKSTSVIWSAYTFHNTPHDSNAAGYGDMIMTVANDLNGDAEPDVVVGTAWGNRSVYAIDGTDGDILWLFNTYTEPQSGWIYEVAAIEDITGDGVNDIAAGGGSDADSGYLINGATGAKAWAFDTPYDAVFGADVIEDIGGNAKQDAIFSCGDDEDYVYAVRSDTGAELWRADTGNNYSSAVIDDLNDDGVQDMLAGSWGSHRVIALSGVSGAELWRSQVYVDPIRIVPMPDANDDGVPDFIVSDLMGNSMFMNSGSDGALIWSWYDTDSIWAVDRLPDVTGDGIDDVAAGGFTGWIWGLDGETGRELWHYDTGDAIVMTVRSVPDADGDGFWEVAAGTQHTHNPAGGEGKVYLLSGNPGL